MVQSAQENFPTISDADKIIIDYLIQRQNQIDSYYDTIDSKIFQILTINGVAFGILALTPDRVIASISIKFGAFCLCISVIIAILGYRDFAYNFGVSEKLKKILHNTDNQTDTLRISELKDILYNSINENLASFDKKCSFFTWSFYLIYIGVAITIIGYAKIIN